LRGRVVETMCDAWVRAWFDCMRVVTDGPCGIKGRTRRKKRKRKRKWRIHALQWRTRTRTRTRTKSKRSSGP
jgi:hypothetical protein